MSANPESAPKKRRLRYGLRFLLLVVVVLAVGLSWWVTWPQRAASRFVELMESDPDRAQIMSPDSGMWRVLRDDEHGTPYLEPHSQSIADVLRAKQTFTVVLPVAGMHLDGIETDLIGTLFFERGQFTGPIELDARPKKSRD